MSRDHEDAMRQMTSAMMEREAEIEGQLPAEIAPGFPMGRALQAMALADAADAASGPYISSRTVTVREPKRSASDVHWRGDLGKRMGGESDG